MPVVRRRLVALAVGTGLLLPVSCGYGGDAPGTIAERVSLVTHDSWSISPAVQHMFENDQAVTMHVITAGDAGSLANRLILTKNAPLADVVFGIDNTFASRVLDEGVIDGDLVPVTQGDVCLNVDLKYFESHGIPLPQTLTDIVQPEYRDLTVVLNPATSSPGLAFLLGTIAALGEGGWQQFWADLRGNGVAISDSWEDAYFAQFSGAGEGGERPIVVSYSTSPAATVVDGHPATAALLTSCFRQIEYAGVLSRANNPEGGRALLEFLQSSYFQREIPDRMFMYPIDTAIAIPEEWQEFAPLSPEPLQLEPELIAKSRDAWIDVWAEIMLH